MTLRDIVEQLEFCEFRDELGHKLEQNAGFVELKNRAFSTSGDHFYLGQLVYVNGIKGEISVVENFKTIRQDPVSRVLRVDTVLGSSIVADKINKLETVKEYEARVLSEAYAVIEKYGNK